MPLPTLHPLPALPIPAYKDLDALQRDALDTLADHIDFLFPATLKFPTALDDDALSGEAEQALARPEVVNYLIEILDLSADAQSNPAQIKLLAKDLCTRCLPYKGTPWLNAIEALPSSVSGYRIAYLAQLLVPILSAQIYAHNAWPAIAIAALLLDRPAISQPSSRLAVLDVANTLELDRLVAFMLPGTAPAKALLAQLEIGTYALAYYLRPLTAAETAAQVPADHAGKRLIRHALPRGKEHQGLDALMSSPAFERWAMGLAEQAGWSLEPQAWPANQALAGQALVDTLYPPGQRVPAQIMGMDLFEIGRAQVPLSELRTDLANHIMRRLGCPLSHAQVATQALLRYLAPECLIDDAPQGMRYRPDLLWVSLRLGAYVQLEQGEPVSFEGALQAVATALSASQLPALYPKRFGEVAWVWAHCNGLVDLAAPSSDDPRHHAEQCLLQALALDQLADVPNRAEEATRRLIMAGVKHDRLAEMTPRYLETHGTFRLPGHATDALDDINLWFSERFEAYLHQARTTFKAVLKRLIDSLPPSSLEHFDTLPGNAYALAWPHYRGPVRGGVPGFADSPLQDWTYVVATHGMVVHLVDAQAHHLYELFPETLAFYHTVVDDPQQMDRLADASLRQHTLPALLRASPSHYLGHALPYQAADFPALRHPTSLPGEGTLTALDWLYSEHIALANRQSLQLLAQGLTPQELARERWRRRSGQDYAWSLIKATVPLASCLDVDSAGDAFACALDGITGLGAAVRVASVSLRAGQRLIAASAALKTTTYRNVARINSAWAASRPVTQAAPAPRGLRRWNSAPAPATASNEWVDGHLQPVRQGTPARLLDHSGEQAYGPALERAEHAGGGWVTALPVARPGLSPGAFILSPGAYGTPSIAVEGLPSPRSVFRGEGVVDLMVDGRPYRYRYGQAEHLAVRADHAALPGAAASPYLMPEPGLLPYPSHPASASLALMLHLKPIAYERAFPGQLLSRAFMARRIETLPAYYRSGDVHQHRMGQVFVLDNRLVSYVDNLIPAKGRRPASVQGKRLEAIATDQAPARLNLPGTIRYRDRITLHLTSEFEFGLQGSVPVAQRQAFALQCPTVRLGSFVQGVTDRRTLRALVLGWANQSWLMVEADTGVFYAAPYIEPIEYGRRVQGLLNTPSAPPELFGPLHLGRVQHAGLIDAYLDLSETYRQVASRATIDSDIANLQGLLRDWIRHRSLIQHGSPAIALDDLIELDPHSLRECARNILVRGLEQDILVGSTGRHLPGLTRSIIPDWLPLHERPLAAQRRHLETLAQLLPVTGGARRLPFEPQMLEALITPQGARSLCQHLGGANLGYARVRLNDGQQRVYYALSGGRVHRALTIAPPSQEQTLYIDARAIMADAPLDPRFTDLPVLRGARQFRPHDHSRGLDSERMIASAINRDLLENAEQVQSIEVFSVFDACRSCGGFVLPRLRLDYPAAQFSITWLIPYD